MYFSILNLFLSSHYFGFQLFKIDGLPMPKEGNSRESFTSSLLEFSQFRSGKIVDFMYMRYIIQILKSFYKNGLPDKDGSNKFGFYVATGIFFIIGTIAICFPAILLTSIELYPLLKLFGVAFSVHVPEIYSNNKPYILLKEYCLLQAALIVIVYPIYTLITCIIASIITYKKEK